jgi:hypothetical protein
VRLRPLTEAECYARCYGGRREEAVALVWTEPPEDEQTSERDPARANAGEGREAA